MSDKIVLSDRIKELSYTVGTGNFSLEGAANGFSSFASQYVNGDSLFYAITDGTRYEIGSGVYATGVTGDYLVRFPFRSSNGDNRVSFPAGTKEVYVTYPATHAVFQGSGLSNLSTPKSSGIAFWATENILDYDSNIILDKNNNRLGINNASPQYTIDLGGSSASSIIRSSGIIVGNSGVTFPLNGDYVGGTQTEHFQRNQLDQYALDNELLDQLTGTDAVFELSGVVNEYILFKQQDAGTVLAGPPSGCTPPCSPGYPSFRQLVLDDFPYLEQVSGILNTRIVTTSGMLVSASGSLNNSISTVSGMFVSGSGALNSAINNVTNNITTISGILNTVSGVSSTNSYSITFVSGDLSNVFDVASVGGKYVFNGVGTIDAVNGINSNLYLHKGLKYKFNLAASGHPFYIKTVASTGTANTYDIGVTNNGEDLGLIVFTVPQTAPDILYYSCANHTGMSGIIFTKTGSAAGDGLVSNINTQEISLDNPSNHYSNILAANTQLQDKTLLWDTDASGWKTIDLGNLLYAPSGKSYIQQKTVDNTSDAGQFAEMAFDDDYAYFYTSVGWKRILLETFGSLTTTTTTTTAGPTTTTTTAGPTTTTTTSTTSTTTTTTTANPSENFTATIQSWLDSDKHVDIYFGGSPLAIIDWGDGSANTYVASNGYKIHNYPSSGEYTLSIQAINDITELRFYNPLDVNANDVIKSIDSFGDKFKPTTMAQFIRGCNNVVSVPNTLSSSALQNLSQAFYLATSLNCDLSSWNVSNVINFSECFRGASSFNGDISTWNTSNGANFSYMFASASSFNQNIGNWDTAFGINFGFMFQDASSFNQYIKNWYVNNANNMESMFDGATSFNQDISGWDIESLPGFSALNNFMREVTLSTTNYNALLIYWDTQRNRYASNLSPNFGNSQCGGIGCLSKLRLISFGWTITDAEGTQT